MDIRRNFAMHMKKLLLISAIVVIAVCTAGTANAQCAMCTKTAQQLGEKPAAGLNSGILYLMLTPFAIVGVIGYRWWRGNRNGG